MLQTATMSNTVPTTSSAPASNAPSFDDLLKDAKDLGEQAGKGKDTQIKFALKLIQGAYLGALSVEHNKHGIGRDDATILSEAYVRASQGAVIFDAKADKTRKLCSTTRKCIKMGTSPKWGRGQPMQFVQEFLDFRQKVRAKDASALKKIPNGRKPEELDDAFNALMRLSTEQLRHDTLLSDDERNAFAFKPLKGERAETQDLEDARKKLRKSGDQSQQVKDAIDAITLRLANIAKGVK